MKQYAQNQHYTSFSFWDLQSFNSFFGHAWSHSGKIASSICSFDRYVPAYTKLNLYLQ